MRSIFYKRYFSRRALNFVDKCEKLKLVVSTEDRGRELLEVVSGTKPSAFFPQNVFLSPVLQRIYKPQGRVTIKNLCKVRRSLSVTPVRKRKSFLTDFFIFFRVCFRYV